jgi:hypothetical protein
MFTYFHKKFRPVNCMHYIKFSVNILLHTSGCCRSLWHLGSLFFHISHYFCIIFHETKHHTQAYITFYALVIPCPFSGSVLNKHGDGVCWPVHVMARVKTQSSVLQRLLCVTGYSCRNPMPLNIMATSMVTRKQI